VTNTDLFGASDAPEPSAVPVVEPTSSDAPAAADKPPRRRAPGLNGMVLAELQQVAAGLGIKGTGRMRKSQLIETIKAAQGGGSGSADPAAGESGSRGAGESGSRGAGKAAAAESSSRSAEQPSLDEGAGRGATRTSVAAEAAAAASSTVATQDSTDDGDARDQRGGRQRGGQQRGRSGQDDRAADGSRGDQQGRQRGGQQPDGQDGQGDQRGGLQGRQQPDGQDGQGDQQDRQQAGGQQGRQQGGQQDRHDDDRGNRRRRRDRRGGGQQRDRRGGGRDRVEEPQIREDDVLIPVAGILDILDNYAFVRTSGYLPGSDDVYVSLALVRRNNLRKGDAITGAVRQPREGEKQQKFNALVRVDTVNGADPEVATHRADFSKLTPLYPQDRLRLETEANIMSTRIIDLVAPIGKGQRGLIVSPAKAGKTLIMQAMANAITTNNPETHLMVVLVDERPEEVTDMQRAVKGEVISSTFDRPAEDHTVVAELAIERAKRLVELGHDVVVLLDSITRLGRAYNLAAPASGRILSGGVDSSALYPPKKFFGAARNIENGGSLTILATALIETGSRADELIFEEFKGTGNMELRLRRDLADKRLYPAIDVDASGTRREEILVSKDELAVMWQLRRVLSALDPQQAIVLMLDRLKKSKNNREFLMEVQKTTPSIDDVE
jgi:transcription termination factor Rho